jgi:hypothetical protein
MARRQQFQNGMAADIASAASNQNLEFQIEYLDSSVKFLANARHCKCCLVQNYSF